MSETPRRSRFAKLTSKLPGASSNRDASGSQDSHDRRSSHSNSLLAPLAPDSPSQGYSNRATAGGNTGGDYYGGGYGGRSSPTYSDQMSSNNHGAPQEVTYRDELLPPVAPFVPAPQQGDGSGLSSRRSSVSFLDANSLKDRPSSLSLNYVPAKFTRLHAQGDYAHRRTRGGGRDAFAPDAQRMGQMGTVDDDLGIEIRYGKGGIKTKGAKLRWNRFKWVLFVANIVLIAYGMATLVSAILVWLNVFYQSDVIRVGNHTELVLSTVAAAMIVLTSLIGFAGIFLNNRAFLAIFTLLLWVDFGLLVAPGYMTYKQRAFNLEGKLNAQWSRNLGNEGRLRIQDALRCCGYYTPFVEATVSPLCYSRSNFPGCKSRYLHLERHILGIWYAVSFALVPAHVLIIVAALLCSNHVTYRFGKGLTPKRYRLDLASMGVIMEQYAGQIAEQYGHSVAQEAMERSSISLALPTGPQSDSYDNSLLSIPNSRRGSSNNLASMRNPGALPGSTRGVSLYDPTNPRASFDHRRDSSVGGSISGGVAGSGSGRYYDNTEAATRGTTSAGTTREGATNESVLSFSSDDHRQGRRI
ncbi:hypothetical protein IAT38_005377 [Cryptococcus sp. DSM 104549]